jgi:hypothetical protein
MAVRDEAMRVVAMNALRLMFDSGLLFKENRFGSAQALAVLSLEETAKHMILRMGGKSNISHIAKQRRLMGVVLFMKAYFSIRLCADLLRDGLERNRELSEHEQGVVGHPEYGEFLNGLRDGKLRDQKSRLASFNMAFTQRIQRDGTFRFLDNIQKGEMSKLKEKGLYADVNDLTGKILNDPALVPKKDAVFWIVQAFLSWAFTMALYARGHFKEIADSITSDPSGLDTALELFMEIHRPTPVADM